MSEIHLRERSNRKYLIAIFLRIVLILKQNKLGVVKHNGWKNIYLKLSLIIIIIIYWKKNSYACMKIKFNVNILYAYSIFNNNKNKQFIYNSCACLKIFFFHYIFICKSPLLQYICEMRVRHYYTALFTTHTTINK